MGVRQWASTLCKAHGPDSPTRRPMEPNRRCPMLKPSRQRVFPVAPLLGRSVPALTLFRYAWLVWRQSSTKTMACLEPVHAIGHHVLRTGILRLGKASASLYYYSLWPARPPCARCPEWGDRRGAGRFCSPAGRQRLWLVPPTALWRCPRTRSRRRASMGPQSTSPGLSMAPSRMTIFMRMSLGCGCSRRSGRAGQTV